MIPICATRQKNNLTSQPPTTSKTLTLIQHKSRKQESTKIKQTKESGTNTISCNLSPCLPVSLSPCLPPVSPQPTANTKKTKSKKQNPKSKKQKQQPTTNKPYQTCSFKTLALYGYYSLASASSWMPTPRTCIQPPNQTKPNQTRSLPGRSRSQVVRLLLVS
jgi:hypothetical protein